MFEIFDGIQVTALGALRGLTEVKRPMYYALICYILVEIPVGYILGFKLGLGANGITRRFYGWCYLGYDIVPLEI